MTGTLYPVCPGWRVKGWKYMEKDGMCGCYHESICGPGACARCKNNCGTTARNPGRDRVDRASTGERSGPERSTGQSSWS